MSTILRQLYTWLALVPLLLLCTVFFGMLCIVLAPFVGPRRGARLTAVPWARLGLWLSGVRVRVQGREHVQRGQSYVVVANHLSLYDIPVLYGWLDMDIRWVAKKEVRSIPVVGLACAALGHVFVDRSDTARATGSLREAQDSIHGGTSIVFFPEGTRSRSGVLQEFKKGAFRMAGDLQLPILPVTIRGTREILPSGTARLTPGRDVTIVIHAPIPVTATGGQNLDQLISLSRSAISAGLAASSAA